jgi:hypothetical protein
VVREDLFRRDPRERISKSFVSQADICGQKAWLSIHHPMPWTAPEKVTFGSAVDAGVEVIVKALAKGEPADTTLADEAWEVALRRVATEENQPDVDEVRSALHRFCDWSVVGEVIWDDAVTQPHLRLELPGIGEVDAHPDLLLADGIDGQSIDTIIDIKTAARPKPANAAATSYTELGLYALLVKADSGEAPANVGYWTYVRSKLPYWQEVLAPVTDHLLTVARNRVAAVARAIEADAILNDGVTEPRNSVFTNGPKYGCSDCQFHPAVGGPCDIAEQAEEVAA